MAGRGRAAPGGGAALKRPRGRAAAPDPVLRQRVANQQLVWPRWSTAAELVRWFGAVQAQDYAGALWALGRRLPEATAAGVEDAVARGQIVRTWPMRGTLHFVPAEDARWMLRLLAPRVLARSAGRYRQLGLDEMAFTRGRRLLERALGEGRRLTRRDAYAVLARGGVSPAGQRGIHVLGHLAQQGVICLGPRAGKQPTFVLFDDWIRRHHQQAGDEALATLALRYFRSHGPATIHDFAWWSGLLLPAARRGVEAARPEIRAETRGGQERWSAAEAAGRRGSRLPAALLPPWDEYVVAYKARDPLFARVRARADRLPYAAGYWLATTSGLVCGTWSRTRRSGGVRVEIDAWARLTAAERAALAAEAARYARFVAARPDEGDAIRTAASP